MNNTHLGNQPDHYSERYTGTEDSGGIYTNSGIANYAFYLCAQGGHHLGGSMTGIGADAASKIWYKALTAYMTSSTNFLGARNATLQAASAIYGQNSVQYNAVAQAWLLVEVGDSNPPSTFDKDSMGVYVGSTSTFNLKNANTSGVTDTTFNYGAANAGLVPIAGDWNGDGIDTIGLYNPVTSTFYLRNSNTSGVADITFNYGAANTGLVPIAGDWNGDGIDTIGVYYPATARYDLRNSNTGGVADITFVYGQTNLRHLIGN